ncbi:MAG: hypothetical protein LBH42_07575 [Treponema sp.]|jgi:hypothetical protein|nr:hypothetical protein [Treponema sp.]
MAENDDYVKTLSVALNARADWLERSELPKLKEELRSYHTGFASLYNIYLKKGLIKEDPYKQETKIGELEVPNSAPFSDAERMDQLTKRLANYDNQLDFLVNFYQFSAEFLNLDRIKRILGLVKYIDWIHLTPDASGAMTKAVAEMTNQIKIGAEPMAMTVITESLAHMNKSFNPIMGHLKTLSDYQRELYKLNLRDITSGMSQSDASNAQQIKKKYTQVKGGSPFYPDLAEEVIKEDFSKDGPDLRNDVLKRLQVADDKPKVVKPQISFKSILIEGIMGLGATAQTFTDILAKMEENQAVLESEKKGFMQKLKKLVQQMLNKDPEEIVYELEYIDPIKGVPVHEKVYYNSFRAELERKIKTLSPVTSRGGAVNKLEAMQEEQLTSFLDRNVRDLQNLHKTLTAMDEFFKTEVDKEDREKIRGIKPELGTIKNAFIRSNAKRHEYSAQKEEEEQLKRLGVKPE